MISETKNTSKTKRDKPNLPPIKNPTKFSRGQLLAFILVFGVIGGYILYRSFAAGPLVATMEAEQMSLPTGASVVTDISASGGKAIELTADGTAKGSVSIPNAVTSLNIVAYGSQCSGAPTMSVAIDGISALSAVAVSATSWSTIPANVNLAAGSHTLSISFNNAYSVLKKHGHTTTDCTRALFVDVTNFYGPTPPPVSPPTVSLSASPTTITAGSSSTLTWSSTNATSCSAAGAWSGTEPTSGSASTGALNQNATFNLTCTGSGGSVTASATVTVSSPPPPSGSTFGTTTVGSSWTGGLIADDKFAQQFSVSQNVSISKLTYYLRGDSATAGQVARAIVYADNNGAPGVLLGQGNEVTVPAAQAAGWVDFSFANPVGVSAGKVWLGLIRGATGGNIDVAANFTGGSETFATNTYSSGASNPFGPEGGTSAYNISGYATYTVSSTPPPTVSLSASPTTITAGSSSTLTWSSTNATSCSAAGAWSGTEPTSGSASTGALNTSLVYSLICTGKGGSASATATVTVNSPPPPPSGSTQPGIGIYSLGGTIYNQSHVSNYGLAVVDNDASEANVVCGLPSPTRPAIYFAASDVNSTYNTGVDWNTAYSNGWLLTDAAGSLLVNQGFLNNNVPDVGNSAFQQAWISNVVSTVNSYHCKGVFIDDVLKDILPLAGEYPTKYPNQPAWEGAMVSFVKAIGAGLKANGIYVAVNASGYTPGDGGSDTGSLTSTFWQEIGPYINGMMNESYQETSNGTNTLRTTGSNWDQNWDGWQQLIGTAQNLGDDFIGEMYNSSTDTQSMRYGKGSFMLEWNGGSSVFNYDNTDGGDNWNTAWTSSLGAPSGSKSQPQANVWQRTYANGVVIVNTTSSTVTVNGHTIAGTDAYIGP